MSRLLQKPDFMKSAAEILAPFSEDEIGEIVACTNLTPQAIMRAHYWFEEYYAEQLRRRRWDYPIGVNNIDGRQLEKLLKVHEVPEDDEPEPATPTAEEEQEDSPLTPKMPAAKPVKPAVVYKVYGCLGQLWDPEREYRRGELTAFEGEPYCCTTSKSEVGMPPPNDLYTVGRHNTSSGSWRLDPLSRTLRAPLICNLPPLRFNPFAGRLCAVFSERDDGQLTFQEFVDLVSYTARVTPRADKLKLLFNLYDEDADGFLTPPDLLQTLYNVLAGGYPWDDELNKQKEADEEGLKRDNHALTNFAKFLQRVKSEIDGGHMVDDARDPCDDPEIRAMVSSWIRSTIAVKAAKLLDASAQYRFERDMKRELSSYLNEVMRQMARSSLVRQCTEAATICKLPDGLALAGMEREVTEFIKSELVPYVANESRDSLVLEFLGDHMQDQEKSDEVGNSIYEQACFEIKRLLMKACAELDMEQIITQLPPMPAEGDSPRDDPPDAEWKLEFEAFVKKMRAALRPDKTPQELHSESWKKVTQHFLKATESEEMTLGGGAAHPNYNIEVVISRMLSEMDPAITVADQQKDGWDKVGRVSFQEFARATQTIPDIETKLTISW